MSYYVYIYSDPRTNLPFYVGKGHGTRAYSHLKESYSTTKNKYKWNTIAAIRKHGFEPIIEIFKDNMSETDAYDLERYLICKFGRSKIEPNGILTNLCIDARPPGNPKAHLGKRHSETTKAIMSKRKERNWTITTPTGITKQITNLKQFCTLHKLNPSSMIKMANNQQIKPYKGYRCKRAA